MTSRPTQYYIPPPNIPQFMYRFSFKAWKDLMIWSWNEYQERLKQHSRRGHYRELAVQASEFSPERILAEMTGFRKLCALLSKNESLWKKFTYSQRDYLIRCYELRDLLLRESVPQV